MDEHSQKSRPFVDPISESEHSPNIPYQDINLNPRPASSPKISHYWNGWRHLEKLIGPRNWAKTKYIWADIEAFENAMRPLEKLEQVLWNNYKGRRSGSVENEVDEDELRKVIQERVTAGEGDTFSAVIEKFEQVAGRVSHLLIAPGTQPPGKKALEYLHQLERLRYRKARRLDDLCDKAAELGVQFDIQSYEQRSDPQAIPEMRSTLGMHFWAVVVGINYYQHLSPQQQLSGCVNDAQLIVGYLTGDLGVPADHILLLTSESSESSCDTLPTRDRILNGLYQHLRDNPLVQYNDNLLFHFSGHGCSYERELGHLRTEALCPCDRSQDPEDILPDISDRELHIIFSEISRNKGPNLTVILDCCHAGGATRDAPHSGSHGDTDSDIGTTRGTAPLLLYSPATNQDEILAAALKGEPDPRETYAVKLMFQRACDDPRRMSGSQSPFAKDWKSDMSSHVLLAACQPAETAKERRIRRVGVFTSALISALTSPRGRDPSMTYTTLFREVIQRSDRQTPVVVGERKKSRLWFQEGDIPETSYNTRSLSSI